MVTGLSGKMRSSFFKEQFDSTVYSGSAANYVDEQYPAFTEDGSLVFAKSGYKQIPEFVIKNGADESVIRIMDYTLDKYFSYRNGKIIYASFRPDLRWGYRDYSDLKILDITNGHQQTLAKRTKYFSPDISPAGKKVIAVNEPASGNYSLEVLDAQTGNSLSVIPNPARLFYTYPKFYSENSVVSAVRNPEGEMSIAQIDLISGKTEFLLPFAYNVIGFPFVQRDTLYFSYSYKKNDELFAYTFNDKKLWRIENPEEKGFGKYHPGANDSILVWSRFTAEGYKLQTISKRALKFIELNPEHLSKVTSSFGVTALNNVNSNLLYKVPNDSFPVSKYSKSFQLFNFHSLEPAVNDPQYSLSIVSENILNTLQSAVSFTYDRSEKYKQLGFSATYAAWFPFLSAGINYSFDRKALYHGKVIKFNQLQPYAGFNIPLNLSSGRSFTFLNFGASYGYNKSSFTGNYKDSLSSISYSYNSNFLSFSHQVQKAQQQIYPRFAQTVSFSYKTALTRFKGFQFVTVGNLYFPGILKTHSLLLNGAYLQKDSLGQISFSSGFPFSRGYQAINLYRMYKWGANYQLPLLYPDAGFADIFYLLRVRANLFYDETRAKDFYKNGNIFHGTFRSTGTEINFDTKWWNQVNVSFGFRYSYLLDPDLFGATGRNRWEIILPVNLFNK